jgi:hypothetical protein
LTYPGAVGDLSQGAICRPQLPANELQRVHVGILRQNSAGRKQQDFSADGRQYSAMPVPITDHRKVLRENLTAWMKHYNVTRDTLNAVYLSGPKKGKKVSARSVGNILSADEGANSPSYDMIVAVCARLEIMPWQLLVPLRGPNNPPRIVATPKEMELYKKFERLRAELDSVSR